LAQEEPLRYSPPSNTFRCELPPGWKAFEEEDSGGLTAHILGPDNPSGTYRTGIDVRWVEKGQAGFVPLKKAISQLRRSGDRRSPSSVRVLRISGSLARTFELDETRLLPGEFLPSAEEPIHHYIALIPSGESYFLIRLSSSRDIYLDYKNIFLRFIKSFRIPGS
jgi:hypothetical protein